MNNGDKPAFSSLHTIDGNWQKEPVKEYQGLTKREYFAAMAMQGFLANPGIANAVTGTTIEENDSILAITSVRVADRILKELES